MGEKERNQLDAKVFGSSNWEDEVAISREVGDYRRLRIAGGNELVWGM